MRIELFDLALGELARAELPLTHQGYDVGLIVRHIADGIATVLRASRVDPARLLGVGVGVPGILDRGGPERRRRPRSDHRLARRPPGIPAARGRRTPRGGPLLHQQRGEGARSGRDVVRRRPGREGRGHRAVRVRSRRLHRHRRRHPWGRTRQRRRVGPPDRQRSWPALPLRRAGLPGGVHRVGGAAGTLAGGRRTPSRGRGRGVGGDRTDRRCPSAGRRHRPRSRGSRRPGRDRGIPGRRHLRPDQPLQPRTRAHRRLGRPQLGPHILPAVRSYAAGYSLAHPAGRVTIDLGLLGPDAVTVGAATLPLADFFAHGGRRAAPVTEESVPPPAEGWRTGLESRVQREGGPGANRAGVSWGTGPGGTVVREG